MTAPDDVTGVLRRVLGEHEYVARRALPRNNADHNVGRVRYAWFCECGTQVADSQYAADEAHAEHVAREQATALGAFAADVAAGAYRTGHDDGEHNGLLRAADAVGVMPWHQWGRPDWMKWLRDRAASLRAERLRGAGGGA